MRPNKEILLMAAILLAGCAPSFAQSTQVSTDTAAGKNSCAAKGEHRGGKHRHFGGMHEGEPFGLLQGQYALTEEQKQKLDNLRSNFRTELKSKFKDMWSTRRQLMDSMTAPQINTAKAKELQKQINDQMVALSNAKLQNRLAAFQILTADQRQELRSQFEKKRAQHQAERANRPAED